MKEKIAHLMKSEGLTSSRLAEVLEIQPSRISHILSGRNLPSFDLLQKILRRFPQINPDWLLLDSPTIYRDVVAGSASGGGAVAASGDDPFGSSPIDLFGLAGESTPAREQNSAGDSTRNFGDFSAQFPPQNQPQNQPQNLGQNSPKNQGQNYPSNWQNSAPQSAPNFGQNGVRVERIIVLYSDGTFTSYDSGR